MTRKFLMAVCGQEANGNIHIGNVEFVVYSEPITRKSLDVALSQYCVLVKTQKQVELTPERMTILNLIPLDP
jgi:hypothetical protein